MVQIAYSELTKRYYFLPMKGKKIDITDDVKEILSAHSPPSLREQPLREALQNVTDELANMIECWDTDAFTDREWDDARKAVEAARTALASEGVEGNFYTDAELTEIKMKAWREGFAEGENRDED